MKIKLTSIYVDDQERALTFYTSALGLVKKAEFSNGSFRWLTVVSPEEPEGAELQLALNDDSAFRIYQQALFDSHRPAVNLFTSNVKGDYERIKVAGIDFTMAPTNTPGAMIVQLNDTCGNLIQITQLTRTA